MVSRNRYLKSIFRTGMMLFLLILFVACQSAEEEPASTPQPTEAAVTVTESETPVATPTLAPTLESAETEADAGPEPTPTSPVPTPTSPLTQTPDPTPSPSPTPAPDPTFHTIVSGDSLIGIADQYQVSLDNLLYANGFASLDEAVLRLGSQLQIPLCEAHQVASGNTLSGISAICDVSLDALVTANIRALAPLGTVDSVPVGFILVIPPPTNLDNAPACTVQPAREQVIEYTPAPGEGINCLAQIYGLSSQTILQANVQRLTGENVYGQIPLLIPPANGAVLELNEDDIENGVTLAGIAEWYDIPAINILDWNGNPVNDPLSAGQQLYIPGANLNFGVFQTESPATPTPEATEEPETTETPEA
jgi:LysM repeat protein